MVTELAVGLCEYFSHLQERKTKQKQKPNGEQKSLLSFNMYIENCTIVHTQLFFFSKLLSKYTHSFSKDLLPEKYMRIFSKILDAQDVNVKAKSIKPLKNSDAKLCYLGLGSDFLDISPEVQAMGKKSKI